MVKRASFSSESANFSIGEKSATVSFGDDASTKALLSKGPYWNSDRILQLTEYFYKRLIDEIS
jgi:hypothetical protein